MLWLESNNKVKKAQKYIKTNKQHKRILIIYMETRSMLQKFNAPISLDAIFVIFHILVLVAQIFHVIAIAMPLISVFATGFTPTIIPI